MPGFPMPLVRLLFGGFLLDRGAEDLLLMLVSAEMKKPPSRNRDKKAEALVTTGADLYF